MNTITYQDLVKAVLDYHLVSRWEVVTYCMGLHGEVTQETFDAIEMLYDNAYINE